MRHWDSGVLFSVCFPSWYQHGATSTMKWARDTGVVLFVPNEMDRSCMSGCRVSILISVEAVPCMPGNCQGVSCMHSGVHSAVDQSVPVCYLQVGLIASRGDQQGSGQLASHIEAVTPASSHRQVKSCFTEYMQNHSRAALVQCISAVNKGSPWQH